MTDIELVIKIPEELKNKIDNANEDNYRTYIWWFDTTLYCAIKNGTPLPKGHGRIADIDKLLEEMRATRTYDIPFALERVKPIIEADKESDKNANND